MAPALTAIALLLVDDRVRNKKFHLRDYEVENENNNKRD